MKNETDPKTHTHSRRLVPFLTVPDSNSNTLPLEIQKLSAEESRETTKNDDPHPVRHHPKRITPFLFSEAEGEADEVELAVQVQAMASEERKLGKMRLPSQAA